MKKILYSLLVALTLCACGPDNWLSGTLNGGSGNGGNGNGSGNGDPASGCPYTIEQVQRKMVGTWSGVYPSNENDFERLDVRSSGVMFYAIDRNNSSVTGRIWRSGKLEPFRILQIPDGQYIAEFYFNYSYRQYVFNGEWWSLDTGTSRQSFDIYVEELMKYDRIHMAYDDFVFTRDSKVEISIDPYKDIPLY